MLIDWLKFAPAVLLLLTPIAVFHGKKVRFRRAAGDWAGNWSQILSLGLHAIDLSRAALGAWLLADALSPAPQAQSLLLRHSVVLTQAAVLLVAVLLQCLVGKQTDSAHAPFAFVTGLILGFLPPVIAGFAVVFAVAIASGVRVPVAYFPVLAISVIGMGSLFTGMKLLPNLLVAAAAAELPWMLSLLFSLDLMVSYRARRTNTVSPSPLR